jgi:hypothetical protein
MKAKGKLPGTCKITDRKKRPIGSERIAITVLQGQFARRNLDHSIFEARC